MARFLHAIDYGSHVAGSFIPALRALTSALDARGHQSLVVSPLLDPPAVWPKAFNGDATQIVHTRRYIDIVPIMRKFRPDVVAVHFSGYSVPTTLFSLGSRRKIFRHVHGFRKERGGTLIRRCTRALHHELLKYRADGIIAVSDEVAMEMATLGCRPGRITTLPNGVDIHYFRSPTPRERRSERERLELGSAERAVLFFGRDVRIKGADVLAAALSRLADPPTIVCIGSTEAASSLRPYTRVLHQPTVEDPRALMWACDVIAVPELDGRGGRWAARSSRGSSRRTTRFSLRYTDNAGMATPRHQLSAHRSKRRQGVGASSAGDSLRL